MLTWLLITALTIFGFGEGIFWARTELEADCRQANEELLQRQAHGPLRDCGGREGGLDATHERFERQHFERSH